MVFWINPSNLKLKLATSLCFVKIGWFLTILHTPLGKKQETGWVTQMREFGERPREVMFRIHCTSSDDAVLLLQWNIASRAPPKFPHLSCPPCIGQMSSSNVLFPFSATFWTCKNLRHWHLLNHLKGNLDVGLPSGGCLTSYKIKKLVGFTK